MEPIRFKKFDEKAIIPTRATDGSVGYDLYTPERITVHEQSMKCIDIHIGVQPPPGYFALIKSRSGLAFRNKFDVLAGVIDVDFVKVLQSVSTAVDFVHPLKVMLFNHGRTFHVLEAGDRIAQLILVKYATPSIEIVDDFPETDRCKDVEYGGLGSTGK